MSWPATRRKLGFTPKQQPELRLYLTLSWKKHCLDEGLEPSDRCRGSQRCGRCVYCAWYEEILVGATRKRSSKACNAGRDYDFLMRDLEIIHGQSTKWQLRAANGDAIRIRHELRDAVENHQIDETYLRKVARNMLRVDELPELEEMEAEQLIIILGEVKRFIRRRLKSGVAFLDNGDPNWLV